MIIMVIIHTTHDIDALIRSAKSDHATEDMIQRIIDLELDYNGNFVGSPQESAYIWRKCYSYAA